MRVAIVEGFQAGLRMSLKLLTVLVPAAALVFLLGQLDLLAPIARLLQPLMALTGLPGEAGLVFVTGALLNIYPAIAMLGTLEFSVPETTVIALMILICHSLIVECSVQARTGSNPLRMALLRIAMAFGAGIAAGRLYGLTGDAAATTVSHVAGSVPADLVSWLQSTATTVALMSGIVIAIMIMQRVLETSGVLQKASARFERVVALFGLPKSTSFLWLVGNTMGLTYGSAVMIQERERNTLTPTEIDALNHHLAVSHSLIEDTLLFVALGAAVSVLVLPRLFLAAAVGWGLRFSSTRSG